MKFSAIVLSLLVISASSAVPLNGRDDVGRFLANARSTLEKRQALTDTAINFLKPLGVPQAMLDLIKTGPDTLIQKIISQPPDQLQATIDSLKQGKIPTVTGIKPKDLMLQFLPGLKVPQFMIDLVKGSPDVIVEKISSLPIDKLQPIISDLQQGKIPTVPDIAPKDLILQFLPGIGVSQSTVDQVKGLPDAAITQIVALSGDQLQQVINDLKQGKIPNIPGVTDTTKPTEPATSPEPTPTPTPSTEEPPKETSPNPYIEEPKKEEPAKETSPNPYTEEPKKEEPVKEEPPKEEPPKEESPKETCATTPPMVNLPAGTLPEAPKGMVYLIAVPAKFLAAAQAAPVAYAG